MNNVSIIIVNHNGRKYLYNCIKSIISSLGNTRHTERATRVEVSRNQQTQHFEIIIFDNASNDNSIKLVEKYFTKYIKNHIIKIIRSKINYGPAKARNIAVRYANYQYLNFLDNDTEVHKDWLVKALKVFKKDKKIAIVQCKLLLNKRRNVIDYVGEYLGTNGFLVQKAMGGEVDRGQYEKSELIMAAKSAAMFIRKDIFKKVGGFDDDYFIYLEETDMGMRVGLSGYKSIYCPKSIVYHVSGGSIESLGKKGVSYNSKFHGTKNYIMTLIKNLDASSLITILPLHIILWLGLSLYKFLTLHFREAFWIFSGIVWNIIFLPKTLYKRKQVQKLRKLSDKTLFKIWIKKVPFIYFLKKAIIKKKVGKARSY